LCAEAERLLQPATVRHRLQAAHHEAAFIDGIYLDEKFFVLRLQK
jgi:hypothetical protein